VERIVVYVPNGTKEMLKERSKKGGKRTSYSDWFRNAMKLKIKFVRIRDERKKKRGKIYGS